MDKKDLKEIEEIVTEAVKDLPTKAEMTEAVKEGNEEMAQMVSKGFTQMEEKMDKQFVEVNNRFTEMDNQFTEVKDSIGVVEAKVNKALNIEYVRLEKRVRVVESKLGIHAPADR